MRRAPFPQTPPPFQRPPRGTPQPLPTWLVEHLARHGVHFVGCDVIIGKCDDAIGDEAATAKHLGGGGGGGQGSSWEGGTEEGRVGRGEFPFAMSHSWENEYHRFYVNTCCCSTRAPPGPRTLRTPGTPDFRGKRSLGLHQSPPPSAAKKASSQLPRQSSCPISCHPTLLSVVDQLRNRSG